jgi:hypothetical protein
MALEIANSSLPISSRDAISGIINNLPSDLGSGVGFLITLAKAIGVVLFIYIVFLIIRAVTQIGSARRLKRIAEGVDNINKKLDLLVGTKNKKKK